MLKEPLSAFHRNTYRPRDFFMGDQYGLEDDNIQSSMADRVADGVKWTIPSMAEFDESLEAPPLHLLKDAPEPKVTTTVDALDMEEPVWPKNRAELKGYLPSEVDLYAKEFKLHSVLSRMIEELLRNRPDNPFQELYEHVTTHLASQYDIISKVSVKGEVEISENIEVFDYWSLDDLTEVNPDRPETLQTFSQLKSMKVMLFLDGCEDPEVYVLTRAVHNILESNPEMQLNLHVFYMFDHALTQRLREHMSVPAGMHPAIAIEDPVNNFNYNFPSDRVPSEENIRSHFDSVLTGTATPTPISNAIM